MNPSSEEVLAELRQQAERENVPFDLAQRVLRTESGGRQTRDGQILTSRAGALGLMQLMPDTARGLGVDPADWRQNIQGGVRYLGQQLRAFPSTELALAAYNAGPRRVRDYLEGRGSLPLETQNYISRITGRSMEPVAQAEPRPAPAVNVENIPQELREPRRQQAEFLRQQSEAERRGAQLTGERAEVLARGEAAARQRMVRDTEAATQRYESQRRPTPAFIPTEETAGSLGALFGLLGVIGTAMGGRGQAAALGAMNSMTGMLTGWREGRRDLYERERRNFDASLRQIEAHNTELRRSMEQAIQLARTNLEAGTAQARAAAAQYDARILAQTIDAQGLQRAYQLQGNITQDVTTMLNRRDQLDRLDRERERRLADEQRRRQEERVARAGPGAAEIMRNQTPEARAATTAFLQNTSLTAQQQNVIANVNSALDTSERVAEIVAQNRDAVGLFASALTRLRSDQVASIQNTFQQLFQSGRIPTQGEADRQIEQQLAELQRRGYISGDVAARAAVVQKALFSLALADAVGTGRPTVFLERSLSGFYSQSLRPETLLELLRERQKDAIERLPTPLLRPDTRTDYRQRYPLLSSRNIETYAREYGARRGGQATPSAPTPASETTIPPAAITRLREDPSSTRRAQFDEIFGAGAAERVLGGRQ